MAITVSNAAPMLTKIPPGKETGKLHLLVVDHDAAVRAACCEIAIDLGFAPQHVSTVAEARLLLRGGGIDVLLLDLGAPSEGGLELLDDFKALDPELNVIVMTAYASVNSAVESMRTGAADYLTKPFGADELTAVLERVAERRSLHDESRQLRERLRSQQGLGNIIGRSPEMEKLYRMLSKVAQGAHPVLILGESGTGKELIARSIHANGMQRSRSFIPIDCGSLAPEMIEAELFGSVQGSRSKAGLLAVAGGGTVLLDQVDDLTLDLQAKIARALEEKGLRPMGSTQRVPLTVRVLAASSRDLTQMVELGHFRKDLYYRLGVVNLRIPPLREHPQDVPLLIAHFLERVSRETGVTYHVSDETLKAMAEYPWPGNVRELENVVERACSLSSGPLLHLGDLPTQLQNFRLANRRLPSAPPAPESVPDNTAVTPLAELEKEAILQALRKLNGDKVRAARMLGIGKTTLYRKLKDYEIDDIPAVEVQLDR